MRACSSFNHPNHQTNIFLNDCCAHQRRRRCALPPAAHPRLLNQSIFEFICSINMHVMCVCCWPKDERYCVCRTAGLRRQRIGKRRPSELKEESENSWHALYMRSARLFTLEWVKLKNSPNTIYICIYTVHMLSWVVVVVVDEELKSTHANRQM